MSISIPAGRLRCRAPWLSRNLLGIGIASFFAVLNIEMSTVVLPFFLSSTLDDAAFALGVVEGAADGLSSLVGLLACCYTDRQGTRRGMAALGQLLMSGSIAALALASSWSHVLLGRTLEWVGWHSSFPNQDAMLVDSTPSAFLGRAFAWKRCWEGLGGIGGPLLATLLLAELEPRCILLLSTIPGGMAALCLVACVKESGQARIQPSPLASLRALPKEFLRLLIPVGLFGIANFANTLLVLYAQQALAPSYGTMQASLWAAGLYTWSSVVYTMSCYPMGLLIDRCRKHDMLGLGYACFTVICLGLALGATSESALMLLFTLSGIYCAAVDISEAPLAASLLDPQHLGAGYGVLGCVNGFGDFISSVTVGFLWTFLSTEAAFSYAAVLSLGATIGILLMRFQPGTSCSSQLSTDSLI